jgi:hypothetical protein
MTSTSTAASASPGDDDGRQVVRKDEESEDDEHRHLGQEREPLVEGDELPPEARGRAADGEAHEVDR